MSDAAAVGFVEMSWAVELERGLAMRVEEVAAEYRLRSTAPYRSDLPGSVVFVDTEATGVMTDDKIVALAAIRIDTDRLTKGLLDARVMHMVCNPGRRSRASAHRIHGYSDDELSRYRPFSHHAPEIVELIGSSELLVGHNVSSDVKLINRELSATGLPKLAVPQFCTMAAARMAGMGPSRSLAAICRTIGIKARRNAQHNAAEDAWMTMQAFLWMTGHDLLPEFPESLNRISGARG